MRSVYSFYNLCSDALFRKNVDKAYEERSRYTFFKKIDEKNVKELSDVEKNDLFYNVVTQQLRRSDVCKTCNNERQMKSLFKLLMIKLKELQEKNFMIIKIRDQLKSQDQRDACAIRK